MLPTCFGIAEHTDTGWRGMLTSQASPHAARHELADYFSTSLPLLASIPGGGGPTRPTWPTTPAPPSGCAAVGSPR